MLLVGVLDVEVLDIEVLHVECGGAWTGSA